LAHLGLAVQVHRPPFTTAAGPPHFLHKSDAQHIGADQHGETADGNGEIDPLHGDPRKRPRAIASDSREPLPTRSLLAVPSHDHGSKRSGDARSHPLVAREAAATSGHRSPPHVASAFALPATADGSLMRAACCPFSTRTARFGSWLSSTTEYIFDRGNFPIPFWLIAGITGIVEIGTSGHRHVLRASCRL
jgi:hypothetical protein